MFCTHLAGRCCPSPPVPSRSIHPSGCTPPSFEPRWRAAGGWWLKGSCRCSWVSGRRETLPPSAPTALDLPYTDMKPSLNHHSHLNVSPVSDIQRHAGAVIPVWLTELLFIIVYMEQDVGQVMSLSLTDPSSFALHSDVHHDSDWRQEGTQGGEPLRWAWKGSVRSKI